MPRLKDARVSDVARAIGAVEALAWGAGISQVAYGLGKYGLTGSPRALKEGTRMLSYATRIHLNVLKAPLTTTFVRGGTQSLANTVPQMVAGIGVGYTLGAVVGTGISQAIWGEKGAKDALDLYTNPKKFINEGLLGAPRNITAIWRHHT
jgi:hypothetical protein